MVADVLLLHWGMGDCSTVLGSWPKGCKFDPGLRQLLSESDSTLLLTLTELYGIYHYTRI